MYMFFSFDNSSFFYYFNCLRMRVISYFIDMYIHNIDYVLCLQILTIDGAAIVTLVFGLVIVGFQSKIV